MRNGKREKMRNSELKQIGVSSGIVKNNFLVRFAVEHNPIAFNVAIGDSLIITGKNMFAAAFRQWFIPNKKRHNLEYFVYIFAALFHQFEVFLELIGKSKITQGLNADWLNAQVFPRFIKRAIPLCGQFPIENGFPFRNSGFDRVVKGRIFRQLVGGTNRAFPVNTNVNSGFGLYSGHKRLLCFKYNRFSVKRQYGERIA